MAVNGASKPTKRSRSQLLDTVPSYPTGSLDFLQTIDRHQINGQFQSSFALKIVIIGAGLGGLATAVALARAGHTVTVYEQAPALGEVGAGIQIPPNSARYLLEWGLGSLLKQRVVTPQAINFRRWKDGSKIGRTGLVPDCEEKFGAPYYVIHRAHFHDALHQRAVQLGVEVVVNARVTEVDPTSGTITLADGKQICGDLIIGADGIKSFVRPLVLNNEETSAVETGFAAYRATVDTACLRDDPDTSWLLEKPELNLWVGDQRHVMSYMIAGGATLNLVLSHPDSSDPRNWDQAQAIDDMRKHFEGWDPQLRKVISMVNSTMKWPLLTGVRLSRWIHPSNKLIILGDAAHAMLPYMSEGAAMAIEDGAALAQAFQLIDSQSAIGEALAIWEKVRLERTSQMQEASLLNGKLWHFADGPEQRARDAGMLPEVEGRQFVSSPNQWSDPTTQRWCYNYNATAEIVRGWNIRSNAGLGC